MFIFWSREKNKFYPLLTCLLYCEYNHREKAAAEGLFMHCAHTYTHRKSQHKGLIVVTSQKNKEKGNIIYTSWKRGQVRAVNGNVVRASLRSLIAACGDICTHLYRHESALKEVILSTPQPCLPWSFCLGSSNIVHKAFQTWLQVGFSSVDIQ